MRLFYCIGLLSLWSAPALAGAWTQDVGHANVIVTASRYASSDFYNSNGNRTAQADYRKYELNPYIEYGLYDGVTLVGNLSLQSAEQDVAGGFTRHSWGLGESEFSVRARLWQGYGFVVSAEPMVKLPPPDSSTLPPLGSPNPDAGLTGSVGYGMDAWGQHHFANLDTQYRHRMGRQRDQVRVNATVGIGVARDWVVMPQAFLTLRTDDPQVASFTQS
ncbi:MAG: hypothetical protein K2Q01_00875, partial [Rickettsiales bacterium]|nr:hypothetical protein [Rickettsiales bacterium]